jgi:4a-hydroxytetrahydrobiopterin dehydratase
MWKEENNKLTKTFKFKDFTEAFAFMTRVAFIAEAHNHHPDWSNSYNTVTIELTTHDKGNVVTQKDKDLATAIDNLQNGGN